MTEITGRNGAGEIEKEGINVLLKARMGKYGGEEDEENGGFFSELIGAWGARGLSQVPPTPTSTPHTRYHRWIGSRQLTQVECHALKISLPLSPVPCLSRIQNAPTPSSSIYLPPHRARLSPRYGCFISSRFLCAAYLSSSDFVP